MEEGDGRVGSGGDEEVRVVFISFPGMDVITRLRVLVREEVDVKTGLWRKEMGEVEVVSPGCASRLLFHLSTED
jgi:hypothetical protein